MVNNRKGKHPSWAVAPTLLVTKSYLCQILMLRKKSLFDFQHIHEFSFILTFFYLSFFLSYTLFTSRTTLRVASINLDIYYCNLSYTQSLSNSYLRTLVWQWRKSLRVKTSKLMLLSYPHFDHFFVDCSNTSCMLKYLSTSLAISLSNKLSWHAQH